MGNASAVIGVATETTDEDDDLMLRRPPPPDFDSQTTGVETTRETRTEDNEQAARTASFLTAWRLLRPA